jgi:hypothetical protein
MHSEPSDKSSTRTCANEVRDPTGLWLLLLPMLLLVASCGGNRGISPEALQKSLLKELSTALVVEAAEAELDGVAITNFTSFIVGKTHKHFATPEQYRRLKNVYVSTNAESWRATMRPSNERRNFESTFLVFAHGKNERFGVTVSGLLVTNVSLNVLVRPSEYVLVPTE